MLFRSLEEGRRLAKIDKSYSSPKWEQWGDFSKMLTKVCKSLSENKYVEFTIDYETIRTGRGGKVTEIIFNVDASEKFGKKETEKDPVDIYEAVIEEIEEDLTVKEVAALIKIAGRDINKIIKAYRIAKQSNVDNLVGFMISAIEKGYEMPKKNTKINSFNDFPQRQRSSKEYEELERIMMA